MCTQMSLKRRQLLGLVAEDSFHCTFTQDNTSSCIVYAVSILRWYLQYSYTSTQQPGGRLFGSLLRVT